MISSRITSIKGWFVTSSVTICEKPSRSTANAPPAGTRVASAARIMIESKRRISSFNKPTAFVSESPRRELEQTSSAKSLVLCCGVDFTPRISYSLTGIPRLAI